MVFDRFRRRSWFDLLLMVNFPYESVSGLFLFATQITTSGVLLNHIPKYLFLELPGEKNPSSKAWPAETKVVLLPSLMDWVEVMVSVAVVNWMKMES